MAGEDSMDDDVFESQEDADHQLNVAGKKTNTPSPTGYRDYKPPAEVLKMCQTDVLEDCEQIVHKTILLGDSGVGKTSLLVKFDTGKFQSGNFSATVGIGFTLVLLPLPLPSRLCQVPTIPIVVHHDPTNNLVPTTMLYMQVAHGIP